MIEILQIALGVFIGAYLLLLSTIVGKFLKPYWNELTGYSPSEVETKATQIMKKISQIKNLERRVKADEYLKLVKTPEELSRIELRVDKILEEERCLNS